jgi:hypothetical protein
VEVDGVADISEEHTAVIFKTADASTVFHRGVGNARQFVHDANNRNTQEKDQLQQWTTVMSNLSFTQISSQLELKWKTVTPLYRLVTVLTTWLIVKRNLPSTHIGYFYNFTDIGTRSDYFPAEQ